MKCILEMYVYLKMIHIIPLYLIQDFSLYETH